MKINSFHHFRAIAIIIIIAGHSFGVTGLEVNSLSGSLVKNLIQGGTALFVFISGFLFHHIFYPKYNYGDFLEKKIKNVLVPYLLLGFAPVVMAVLMNKGWFDGYFLPTGPGFFLEFVVPMVKYYSAGTFLTAYWYIPFIMVVFITSPLHIYYIRLDIKLQLATILLFSIMAIFIHRPVGGILVFQSVIYYMPIYFFGITASIHKEFIYRAFRGKEFLFLLTAVGLAFYQASLGDVGNYQKQPFDYAGVDWMFLQKIALCLFFMIFLKRFEEFNNYWVHNVAATSFTAFFIHPFILAILIKLELTYLNMNSWVFYILFVFTVTAICVIFAKTLRKLLPKYSRYIIGY